MGHLERDCFPFWMVVETDFCLQRNFMGSKSNEEFPNAPFPIWRRKQQQRRKGFGRLISLPDPQHNKSAFPARDFRANRNCNNFVLWLYNWGKRESLSSFYWSYWNYTGKGEEISSRFGNFLVTIWRLSFHIFEGHLRMKFRGELDHIEK